MLEIIVPLPVCSSQQREAEHCGTEGEGPIRDQERRRARGSAEPGPRTQVNVPTDVNVLTERGTELHTDLGSSNTRADWDQEEQKYLLGGDGAAGLYFINT